MNKKFLLILLFIIILFAIVFYFLMGNNSKVSTTTTNIIPKRTYWNLTNNFIMIENVSFFDPYLLNVNFSDVSGKGYPLVNDIKFLGYYQDNVGKYIYVIENNDINKYNSKDLISQRYYILKIMDYQLIVLDTNEGTIKLIISNSYGGNQLWEKLF